MKDSYESEKFEEYGPKDLKNVDWSILDERRSVAASLVEGVYINERDRQKKRKRDRAQAPIWWEFFHFKLIKNLEDVHDHSIFGSVFEYMNPQNPNKRDNKPPESRPPKYVIALRGTFLKWRTIIRDGYLDAKYILNSTKNNTRYQTTLQAVQGLIDKVGQENIWLAGHSLGAAIALQVGKTMAIEGHHINAFLFNPPYLSVPIEKLSSRKLKTGIRMFKSLVTVGAVGVLAAIKETSTSNTQLYDTFNTLRPWIPHLCVNHKDPICSEYIGYFEHSKTMESWGLGFMQLIAGSSSLVSLLLGSSGLDCEPGLHLIPSALIVKNLKPMEDDLELTHGIEQWWARHTHWHTERYEFDNGATNAASEDCK